MKEVDLLVGAAIVIAVCGLVLVGIKAISFDQLLALFTADLALIAGAMKLISDNMELFKSEFCSNCSSLKFALEHGYKEQK